MLQTLLRSQKYRILDGDDLLVRIKTHKILINNGNNYVYEVTFQSSEDFLALKEIIIKDDSEEIEV